MKKKYAITALSISLVLAFTGCSGKDNGLRESGTDRSESNASTQESVEETKESEYLSLYVGNYSDSCWTEDYETELINMTYPIIALSGEDKDTYPELAEALQELSGNIKKEMRNAYENDMDVAADDYKMCVEEGYPFYGPYTSEAEFHVVRADDKAVGIVEEGYSYCGGAHGIYYSGGWNFDTKTGKKLDIKDVVTDTGKLADIVEEKVFAEYDDLSADRLFLPEGDTLSDYVTDMIADEELSLCWVITNVGIEIYFNPYEIASYADGLITARVGFQEYPEIFSDYYAKAPEAFVMPYLSYSMANRDLDNDGSADYVSVWAEQDEYDTYTTLHVVVNGVELTCDLWAYGFTPYFVHTGEGKTYLYVLCSSDNDYEFIKVFSLNGKGPSYVDEIGNCGFRWQLINEEEYEYAEEAFLNPDSFYMTSHLEVLSTYGGYRRYHVGADGMPVTEDEWYVIPDYGDRVLTAKQDVVCKLVDEDGSVISGEAKIPSGTKLTFYRTDGKEWVDLTDGDKIYRVFEVRDEWPYKINGVDEEELFDGIMYAG